VGIGQVGQCPIDADCMPGAYGICGFEKIWLRPDVFITIGLGGRGFQIA